MDRTRRHDPEAARSSSARPSTLPATGRWDEAVRSYAEALALEPDRASLHADWARARWRAAGRRVLDVESLTDGGPELIEAR